MPRPSFSTGVVGLDDLLGGGYRAGQLVEIRGAPGAGKSNLVLRAVTSARALRKNVLWVDADCTLDERILATANRTMGQMWLCRPATIQEACRIARLCLRSGAFGLVVFDSVCALSPQRERQGSSGINWEWEWVAEMSVVARLAKRMRSLVLVTRQKSGKGSLWRRGYNLELAYCSSTSLVISGRGRDRRIHVVRSLAGVAMQEKCTPWPRLTATLVSG